MKHPNPDDYIIPIDSNSIVLFEDKNYEPDKCPQLFSYREYQGFASSTDFVPLGLFRGKEAFGVSVTGIEMSNQGLSVPLRKLFGIVEDELFWLLGRAAHLVHWHGTSQFCGSCGSVTTWHTLEVAKTCTSCGFTVYPRISPAVITAITRRSDPQNHQDNNLQNDPENDPEKDREKDQTSEFLQVLLAKHRGRSTPYYGLIAGFIEPGETAEQAVIREIKEETGLEVKNIRYVKSQAWPFPENLMLGFTAEYHRGIIVLQESELEHADWFSRDNLPPLPPTMSLSRYLTGYVLDIDWTTDSHRLSAN